MPLNLKAMIVVLAIALAVFHFAKPICLRFMAEADFTRRRNTWLVLTLVGFLSPNFWVFVFISGPIIVWSAHKDSNVIALYLLLMHIVPPMDISLPVPGLESLFFFAIYRHLAFTITVPATLRLMTPKDKTAAGRFIWFDLSILAYLGLLLVSGLPYESITSTIRRVFLYGIDTWVLYFVVSRICSNRRALVDTMATYCLTCAIFAALAVFETARSWLLYEGIKEQWGRPGMDSYMFRGEALRAQVSAAHSIPLGLLIAIGFGFWLYLSSHMRAKSSLTILVGMGFWMGLFAAFARGPLIGAVVIFFAYLALVPKASPRFFKALFVTALAVGLVVISPIGDRVIDFVPFMGKSAAEAGSVIYRQQLAAKSWELIQLNPFFGSPFVMSAMEDLRQGEGIIDLVNTYANVALFSGLVGLCLFLAPFIFGLSSAYRLVKKSAGIDPDLSLLGVSLIACTLGTLLVLATASFFWGVEQMYWILAGLVAGYTQLSPVKEETHAQKSLEPQKPGPRSLVTPMRR